MTGTATVMSTIASGIKLGGIVYNNKQMILSTIYKAVNYLIASDVIITGVSGSGKTYLLEYITHEVKDNKMLRKGVSVKGEDYILFIGNGNLPKKITVVPGQKIASSNNLLNNLLDNNEKRLSGIIHVMDYGHSFPRDSHSIANFESFGINTLEKAREYNIEEELNYLDAIVNRIEKSKQKPKWFCLALTKTDLYKSSKAISYYRSNDRFKKIITKLEQLIPAERIKYFIPTCSTISTVNYGKQSVHPKYVKDPDETLLLLKYFLAYIQMLDI